MISSRRELRSAHPKELETFFSCCGLVAQITALSVRRVQEIHEWYLLHPSLNATKWRDRSSSTFFFAPDLC
jgi:hypothetical protein